MTGTRAIDGSDRMMEILLKAHRPEKFVERIRADHISSDGSMSPPSLADFYRDAPAKADGD